MTNTSIHCHIAGCEFIGYSLAQIRSHLKEMHNEQPPPEYRTTPMSQGSVLDELNKRKLIVLWEIETHSDRFQQVMLLPEGLMQVEAMLMANLMHLDKMPGVSIVVCNPTFAVKFDNIPPHYSPKQIIAQANKGPDRTRP